MITAKQVLSILKQATFNPKTSVQDSILAQQESCSFYEHDIKLRISQLISAADHGRVDSSYSYEQELLSIIKDAVLAIHTMRKLNGTNDTKTERTVGA